MGLGIAKRITTVLLMAWSTLMGNVFFYPELVQQFWSACRFRYELSGEAVGLGVSGGITALLLILLAAAAAGGSSGQNTGATTLTTGYIPIYPILTSLISYPKCCC